MVAGRNTTFVPTMLAVPFVGLTEIIVSASPSGSPSFAKTGTVTETFYGVLPESFTATGGRLVTAVTTGALKLFVEFGSTVGLPADAKFVTAPRDVVVTFKARFVTAPDARLPRFVQTIWLPVIFTLLGSALENAMPAGRLSVTDKFAAADGPKFVTEIV